MLSGGVPTGQVWGQAATGHSIHIYRISHKILKCGGSCLVWISCSRLIAEGGEGELGFQSVSAGLGAAGAGDGGWGEGSPAPPPLPSS